MAEEFCLIMIRSSETIIRYLGTITEPCTERFRLLDVHDYNFNKSDQFATEILEIWIVSNYGKSNDTEMVSCKVPKNGGSTDRSDETAFSSSMQWFGDSSKSLVLRILIYLVTSNLPKNLFYDRPTWLVSAFIKTGIKAPVGSRNSRCPITLRSEAIEPEWVVNEMYVLLS